MRRVLAACALSCLALAACSAEPDARARPNIVLVIADDQSWRDFGFMGSPVVKTPALDALAESGVVFTHGFTTASSCRPSLLTFLTGLEPQRIQALQETLRAQGVPFAGTMAATAVDSLPRALATRSYASFQGGKYWEGSYSMSGFTEGTAEGIAEGGLRSGSVLKALSGGEGADLGRTTMEPLFDFIDRHRDEPFFVWFAPMLPHEPHDPPWRLKQLYKGLPGPEKRYYAMVSWLDERVGELLAHLDAQGLRERTVVVFMADNGWDQTTEGGPLSPHLGGPRGKFSIYENGFRTPMIWSWPGTFAAGRRRAEIVSAIDVFPTLLELAGVEDAPAERSGESLVPLLLGEGELARRRVIGGVNRLRYPLAERPPGSLAKAQEEEAFFLRAPGWRYVWRPERGIEELYAIDDDPWEKTDLSVDHPERVAEYREAVSAWRERMRRHPPLRAGAQLPVPVGRPPS